MCVLCLHVSVPRYPSHRHGKEEADKREEDDDGDELHARADLRALMGAPIMRRETPDEACQTCYM